MAVVEQGGLEPLMAGFEVLLSLPRDFLPHVLGSAVVPPCREKTSGATAYFYDISFPVSSVRGVPS